MIHSSYCIGSVAPHLETFTVARGAAFNIFQVIDKVGALTALKDSCPYCKKDLTARRNLKDRHIQLTKTTGWVKTYTLVIWL